MRVLLTFLVLSGYLSLSEAGDYLQDGFPFMYLNATDQLAILQPPNAWHYLHRMSFYRILIAHTEAFTTLMGPGVNQSPLWGLPLQLGWLKKSGRLADPTEGGTCGSSTDDMCISPKSWWSCLNYMDSVLPFLSAVHNGMLGPGVSVQLEAQPGAEGYCTNYQECQTAYPNAMASWDKFFRGPSDPTIAAMADIEKKDAILGLYWEAILLSRQASSACANLMNAYSGEEKAFAESWDYAGEFIAATNFLSSLELSSEFMKPLPPRVLKEGDVPNSIVDMTTEENHSLYIFSWMKTMNTLTGGTLVTLWRQVMCSVEMRESGRNMIKDLMLKQDYNVNDFASFITTSMSLCS